MYMAKEARVIQLQKDLIRLGFDDSLRALSWMLETMNAQNGYQRHDGSHYYYHLVDGCQDLINHGIDNQDVLTGYILHDAKEDIPEVTSEMIASKFNSRVALYVDGVTKKEGVNYKNPNNLETYLAYQLEFVEMALIKTADRKHNFSTLEHATPEKELRVANETETYFLPYFKEARQRYPQYSAYFHSAKTEIVPHLKKIKKYHEDIASLKQQHDIEIRAKEREIEDLKLQLSKLKGE
jgi:guanosine-3',5'-bis(diphosphate) 3'-pyrophosphohydrolase